MPTSAANPREIQDDDKKGTIKTETQSPGGQQSQASKDGSSAGRVGSAPDDGSQTPKS